MYLVSACLLGLRTRYDGESRLPQDAPVVPLEQLIPICPEQLGGLPTPRHLAEIQGGRGEDVLAGKAVVINNQGENVTRMFLKGARETLYLALLYEVKGAFLKNGSPSCGCYQIYDGSFKNVKRPGSGVTAALLRAYGITVYDEDYFFGFKASAKNTLEHSQDGS